MHGVYKVYRLKRDPPTYSCHHRRSSRRDHPSRRGCPWTAGLWGPATAGRWTADQPRWTAGQPRSTAGQLQSTAGQLQSTAGQPQSTAGQPQSIAGRLVPSTAGHPRSTCGRRRRLRAAGGAAAAIGRVGGIDECCRCYSGTGEDISPFCELCCGVRYSRKTNREGDGGRWTGRDRGERGRRKGYTALPHISSITAPMRTTVPIREGDRKGEVALSHIGRERCLVSAYSGAPISC